jgi:hypothetical protein
MGTRPPFGGALARGYQQSMSTLFQQQSFRDTANSSAFIDLPSHPA